MCDRRAATWLVSAAAIHARGAGLVIDHDGAGQAAWRIARPAGAPMMSELPPAGKPLMNRTSLVGKIRLRPRRARHCQHGHESRHQTLHRFLQLRRLCISSGSPIDLDAETGTAGHFHDALLLLDRLLGEMIAQRFGVCSNSSIGGIGRNARRLVRQRGQELHRGGEPDRRAPGMRHRTRRRNADAKVRDLAATRKKAARRRKDRAARYPSLSSRLRRENPTGLKIVSRPRPPPCRARASLRCKPT